MCERDKPEHAEDVPAPSLEDIVDEILVLLTNARIYADDHPRVQAAVEQLELDLERWCAAKGREDFVLGAVEGYVVHDKRPLLGASLTARRLIEPLERMNAGGIALRRGATTRDLLALAQLLGRAERPPESADEAARELLGHGCRKVRVLPPYRVAGGTRLSETGLRALLPGEERVDEVRKLLDIDVPVKLYQGIVDHMQDVMIRACRRDRFDLERSRSLVAGILMHLERSSGKLLNLARYERYDAYTFGHSIRVCLLALDLAKVLTREEEVLHRVGMAALLHDVGKAWLPFEILHSTTRLSNDQRQEMNRHTEYGGRILLSIGADPAAVVAAFGHHRTPVHRGYPMALHPAQLSTITRLVKICDVFEALTAVRPYKDSMSPTRAFRIMIAMGEHFDLNLLNAFIRVHGVYPAGSRLRLSSGEVAQVVAQTRDLRRPRVQIVESAEGEPLRPAPDQVVDLSSDGERGSRDVSELLARGSLELDAAA